MNDTMNMNEINFVKHSELQDKKKFLVEKEKEGSTKSDEAHSFIGHKSERADNKLGNRRSKHDLKGRDYLCSLCWKSYLSYAAMYVHLKKKHNVTIDDLKTSYLKRNKVSPIEVLNKVRGKKNFQGFENKFEDLFQNIFNDVYEIDQISKLSRNLNFPSNYDSTSSSSFKSKYSDYIFENKNYINSRSFLTHPLYNNIKAMYMIFRDKSILDKMKNSDLMKNLDNALSLFIFCYWSFNGTSENMMNIRIAILFREFLNFIGWDHLQLLANYKIVDHNCVNRNEEYTKVMLSENLPELIDDFLGVFLLPEAPGFTNNHSEVKYFISEFCNFIYNEGLINYMVEPLE